MRAAERYLELKAKQAAAAAAFVEAGGVVRGRNAKKLLNR
jgi:hypothetical protein